MRSRLIASLIFAWSGLFFTASSSAFVAAPVVADPAYWALQRTLGNIISTTSTGTVIAAAQTSPLRAIPWVNAFAIGATVWAVAMAMDGNTPSAVDVYPTGSTVCFDARNNLNCSGPGGAPPATSTMTWKGGGRSWPSAVDACRGSVGSEFTRIVYPYLSGSTYAGCQSTRSDQIGGTVSYSPRDAGDTTPTPPLVTKPNGRPGVKPGGAGFMPSEMDGDAPAALPTTNNGSLPMGWNFPGVLTREATDSQGYRHRQAVSPLSDGGLNVTTQDEYLDSADNRKKTLTQSITVGADGKVTDKVLSDAEGGLPLPTGSPSVNPSTPELKIETCGLPGKPKCNVIVDETGTPTWTDKPATALDGLKNAEATKRDELMGQVPQPDLGWFGAPPIADCAPFEYPNNMGSLNPCGVVNQTREVMAYLWALAAAWLSFGMIRKAATGGS